LKLHISARPLAAGAVSVGALAAAVSAAPAQTGATTATVASKPQITVGERRLNVRLGRHVVVRGRLAPAPSGVRVALQMWNGRHWSTIDRDRTRPSGRYVLRDRRRSTGSRSLRVRNGAAPGVLAGKRRVGRLNVFRTTHASWYGPGLYGNPLGCGGTLTPGRLGVAHKTLPCGSKVTLKHGRRTVRVPVIDRGPYVAGREYDLTQATAQRLGFAGHGALLVTR
jgi:rare lipoprotein A